jgi:superfamily II DNA or RNA helicase
MLEGMTPFQHQRNTDARFRDNDGRLVIAHGTGTGKTFGSLNALESARAAGRVARVLVITPSGLRRNYTNSVAKFTDQPYVVLGNQQEVRTGEAVSWRDTEPSSYHVISIEMFRRDPVEIVQTLGIDTIVFDEVHKARNPYGKTHKALMEASNRADEIIPLLDFVYNKDHPFGTQSGFRRRYFEVVGHEQGLKGGKKPVYRVRRNLRKELQKRISPYVDYIDVSAMDPERFPDKEVEVIPVEMSMEQKRHYDYAMAQAGPIIKAWVGRGVPPDKKNLAHVFSQLQTARAVSNSVAVLNERISLADAANRTPKIKRALDDVSEELQNTPDAQVIIYSNLIRGGADVIMAGLEARGIEYGLFLGKGQPGSSEEERQEAVSRFRKGDLNVIVVSRAGAEGLDLPDTTFEVILDGHYNPEVTRQAEARGVRAGGLSHRPPDRRSVKIRRYVSTKRGETSVDQWVYSVAARKSGETEDFRSVLRKTNPVVYKYRERIEKKRIRRLPSIEVRTDKVKTPPPMSGLGRNLAKKLFGKPGKRPTIKKPYKYVSRWRDPESGEWRYRYPPRPKEASVSSKTKLQHAKTSAVGVRNAILKIAVDPRPASSYAQDFVAGFDPLGVATYGYGSRAQRAGLSEGEHRKKRAIGTVGGVVGGGLIIPSALGAVAGSAGGFRASKGAPVLARLSSAARGAGRGAAAPITQPLGLSRATKGLEGLASGQDISGKQHRAIQEFAQKAGVKGTRSRAALDAIRKASKGQMGSDLSAVRELLPPGVTEGMGKYTRSALTEAADLPRRMLRHTRLALGAGSLIGGLGAYLQYGLGRSGEKSTQERIRAAVEGSEDA